MTIQLFPALSFDQTKCLNKGSPSVVRVPARPKLCGILPWGLQADGLVSIHPPSSSLRAQALYSVLGLLEQMTTIRLLKTREIDSFPVWRPEV